MQLMVLNISLISSFLGQLATSVKKICLELEALEVFTKEFDLIQIFPLLLLSKKINATSSQGVYIIIPREFLFLLGQY